MNLTFVHIKGYMPDTLRCIYVIYLHAICILDGFSFLLIVATEASAELIDHCELLRERSMTRLFIKGCPGTDGFRHAS